MGGLPRIGGVLINDLNDFVFISNQMSLEEAIKSLEKVDYGIITDESNNIECLVTAKVLNDLLGKATKSLENIDHGKITITDERNNIEIDLVTAKVLNDLLKKIRIEGNKTSLQELRRWWPPTAIASLAGEECINENYYSIRVDAPTIKAGASGVIFVRNNQVKGIMAFKDLSSAEDLKGEVLVKSLDIFDDLSLEGLGGSIGVDCIKYCNICGEEVYYHSYNSEAPPICINKHKVIL